MKKKKLKKTCTKQQKKSISNFISKECWNKMGGVSVYTFQVNGHKNEGTVKRKTGKLVVLVESEPHKRHTSRKKKILI